MESGTNTTPEFVLTSKTLVERKLVQSTAVYSAAFYCLILLFMYGVFLNDLQLKWFYGTRAGRFDEIPRMSEPAKMREQLKNVASDAPGLYYYLYRHSRWQVVMSRLEKLGDDLLSDGNHLLSHN